MKRFQICTRVYSIKKTIGGFTPAVGPDTGVEQACGGNSSGYDTTTSGTWGQFTNSVNGSADLANSTQELCYSLVVTSAPVGSTATFSIDQTGVVTLDVPGTTVNGTYEFTYDVTNPVATLSCSPSSIGVGGVVTCTCSGTDSGSGINNSATSPKSSIISS